MREFVRIAAKRIATFAGVKFSHADLSEAQQCVEMEGGRFNIVWGVDQVRVVLVTRFIAQVYFHPLVETVSIGVCE